MDQAMHVRITKALERLGKVGKAYVLEMRVENYWRGRGVFLNLHRENPTLSTADIVSLVADSENEVAKIRSGDL